MIDARGFNDSTSAIGFILAWENEGLHISNARNDQLLAKLEETKKQAVRA